MGFEEQAAADAMAGHGDINRALSTLVGEEPPPPPLGGAGLLRRSPMASGELQQARENPFLSSLRGTTAGEFLSEAPPWSQPFGASRHPVPAAGDGSAAQAELPPFPMAAPRAANRRPRATAEEREAARQRILAEATAEAVAADAEEAARGPSRGTRGSRRRRAQADESQRPTRRQRTSSAGGADGGEFRTLSLREIFDYPDGPPSPASVERRAATVAGAPPAPRAAAESAGIGGAPRAPRAPTSPPDRPPAAFDPFGGRDGHPPGIPPGLPFSFVFEIAQEVMRGATNHQPPSRGAKKEVIDALPTVAGCSDDACAICQDNFTSEERPTRMPCGHTFHLDCLKPWLADHNTCPTCRHELDTDSAQYNRKLARQRDELAQKREKRVKDEGCDSSFQSWSVIEIKQVLNHRGVDFKDAGSDKGELVRLLNSSQPAPPAPPPAQEREPSLPAGGGAAGAGPSLGMAFNLRDRSAGVSQLLIGHMARRRSAERAMAELEAESSAGRQAAARGEAGAAGGDSGGLSRAESMAQRRARTAATIADLQRSTAELRRAHEGLREELRASQARRRRRNAAAGRPNPPPLPSRSSSATIAGGGRMDLQSFFRESSSSSSSSSTSAAFSASSASARQSSSGGHAVVRDPAAAAAAAQERRPRAGAVSTAIIDDLPAPMTGESLSDFLDRRRQARLEARQRQQLAAASLQQQQQQQQQQQEGQEGRRSLPVSPPVEAGDGNGDSEVPQAMAQRKRRRREQQQEAQQQQQGQDSSSSGGGGGGGGGGSSRRVRRQREALEAAFHESHERWLTVRPAFSGFSSLGQAPFSAPPPPSSSSSRFSPGAAAAPAGAAAAGVAAAAAVPARAAAAAVAAAVSGAPNID